MHREIYGDARVNATIRGSTDCVVLVSDTNIRRSSAPAPTVIRSFVVQASTSVQPVNNDGLTKHQLDLIQQIMQQTQQQAAAHQKQQQNNINSTKNSVASNGTTSSTKTVTSSNKSRTWTVQVGRPHGCSVCETETYPPEY
jgi:hypothetical protein